MSTLRDRSNLLGATPPASGRSSPFGAHSRQVPSGHKYADDLESQKNFEDRLIESFGIPRTFIQELIRNVPDRSWTLPGRNSNVSLNTISLGALAGTSSTAASVHTSTEPVGRLG